MRSGFLFILIMSLILGLSTIISINAIRKSAKILEDKTKQKEEAEE